METKQNIRKQIFKARKEATDMEVLQHSFDITDKVLELPEFQQADTILIYVDYQHEVMTSLLIYEAWRQHKKVCVPKVHGKEMIFYEISDMTSLKPGYFGILEPEGVPEASWGDNALMIMPGVAFDTNLHRVGYGGGFYDRFLEVHKELRRVALGFEFQILPEVPYEDTDICPEILVTEKRVHR
ncbi:MAG: 5-formyltetrahydrofolate cyclo-ligase [Eubacteriales bacterium]|nr:5-formyltetrahydrofolate cyclo-ligase [Eubacteriales bacterium]